MSDRIDELVLDGCVFVACPRPQDCDTCPLTELATIAREADARALIWQLTTENTQKLLNGATERAAEWIDRCYQSEERALKAEAMCEWLAGEVAMGRHDTVDNVLDAAREAVENER